MAADQRKKRLNGTTLVGCSSRQQNKAKKKKLGFAKHDSNINPHVYLQWDDNQKKVVAKREQICITKRELSSYYDFGPPCKIILADVLSIPPEVFESRNIEDLLSYEVWQTYLSEKERELLAEFLPKGSDAQEVVRALFEGNNFNFGNPFSKWAASLSSGNLHPDIVLHQEKCFQTNKREYYSELQKYHEDMIENLQKLKDIFETCKDAEMEFLPNIVRSGRHLEKGNFMPATEFKKVNPDESLGTTSESSSGIADEKSWNTDHHNFMMTNGRELKKRKKEKTLYPSFDTVDGASYGAARSKKGENPTKRNIHFDAAKYMSYVKITKHQHELLKSLKQSGKSIKSVLGDLANFNVQPYENFEEEERNKLRNHWLQVAKVDLPEAITNWRRIQSQRQQINKHLDEEIKEKLKCPMEVKQRTSEITTPESPGDTPVDNKSTTDDEDSVPASPEFLTEQLEFVGDGGALQKTENALEDSCMIFSSDVTPVGQHEESIIDMTSEGTHIFPSANDSPLHFVDPGVRLISANVSLGQGMSSPSAREVWPADNLPRSYYYSAPSDETASAREVSLRAPQAFENHQPQFFGLESEMHEVTEKNVFHRQSHERSFTNFHNQDQSELHQTFRGQGSLPYKQEQNLTGPDFQLTTSMLMGCSQLPVQFQEQLQPPLLFEGRQKSDNELYLHQNSRENVYNADRDRIFLPNEEHLASLNGQDWPANSLCMQIPMQTHTNSGSLMSRKWYSGEHQAHSGWSASPVGAGIPKQSLRNERNSDESLFGVLSQYSRMRPVASHDLVGSSEHLIPQRNYGVIGGNIPRHSNILPPTSHPLDFLNAREPNLNQFTNNIGWINGPPKNSGFDPMGEPCLRSWNQ